MVNGKSLSLKIKTFSFNDIKITNFPPSKIILLLCKQKQEWSINHWGSTRQQPIEYKKKAKRNKTLWKWIENGKYKDNKHKIKIKELNMKLCYKINAHWEKEKKG